LNTKRIPAAFIHFDISILKYKMPNIPTYKTTQIERHQMNIYTTAIIKGGAGKTTTAAALAQYAAFTGRKVLAIDLDPQANLTTALNAVPGVGSYELISDKRVKPGQVIQTTPQGLDVAAASPTLAALSSFKGSGYRLARALAPLKNVYDLVIIDTPPAIAETTYNALIASNGVIIPMETDKSNLAGLDKIVALANEIKQTANPDLQFLGALLTRYEQQANLNQYLKGVIKERCNLYQIPFLNVIRKGIAIKEAQAFEKNLYEYAPNSKPAQDYKELAELLHI
jgi:chromosome partitioning protein